MRHHYRDITSRIEDPPVWWDEAGVPRYCEFEPGAVSDVYPRQVALMEIACQNCGRRFQVAMSWGSTDQVFEIPSLEQRIEDKTIHYGDPPNVRCCPSGPTMSSDPVRVIEFWKDDYDWERIYELEVQL